MVTQIMSINNSLIFIALIVTETDIGGGGASPLSDALKSNTTLTKLGLDCEHNKKSIQVMLLNNPLFFSFHQNTR